MDTQILAALKAREPARALELATQWLAERPLHAPAHRLHALAQAHGGDYAGARAGLEALLAREPDDARAQLILAQVLLQLEPDLAGERFATAAQLDPNLGLAHVGRADTELKRGDLREAESLYRTALRADARLLPALIGLCQVLSLSGRHEEAVKLGNQAVQAGPDSPLAMAAYGRALLGNGNTAFAEQAFRRALELEPGYLPAEHQLVMIDLKAGRLGDAGKQLDALLLRHPRDPQFLELKGDLLRVLSQHGPALAHYERAMAAAPGDLRLFEKLIAHLFATGKQEDGLERLARAARAQPEATPLWHGWLSALMHFGRPQEALAIVREWQQAAPESSDPLIYETAVRDFAGDLAGAAHSALAVVERVPGQPAAVSVLIREALGRRDGRAALRWLGSLDTTAMSPEQRHRAWVWEGRAHDLIAARPEAMTAWQRAAALVKNDPLPKLAEPSAASPQTAKRPEGGAGVIYLVGLPGSGVAPLANMLREVEGARVLIDRLQDPAYRGDLLAGADPTLLDMDLAPHELAHHAGHAERIRRQLAGPEATRIIDWLPQLDARAWARIAAAEPEARWVIVQRDPRDCLLQLYAVGSGGLADPQAAADRLARQQAQLKAILGAGHPAVRGVSFDALLREPTAPLSALADWLGLPALPLAAWPELLKEGGGYPVYLPPQHWVAYGPELRAAFNRCAPTA